MRKKKGQTMNTVSRTAAHINQLCSGAWLFWRLAVASTEITQLDWDTNLTNRHAFLFVILWGMGIRKLPTDAGGLDVPFISSFVLFS
jgi:hypothetical protein